MTGLRRDLTALGGGNLTIIEAILMGGPSTKPPWWCQASASKDFASARVLAKVTLGLA